MVWLAKVELSLAKLSSTTVVITVFDSSVSSVAGPALGIIVVTPAESSVVGTSVVETREKVVGVASLLSSVCNVVVTVLVVAVTDAVVGVVCSVTNCVEDTVEASVETSSTGLTVVSTCVEDSILTGVVSTDAKVVTKEKDSVVGFEEVDSVSNSSVEGTSGMKVEEANSSLFVCGKVTEGVVSGDSVEVKELVLSTSSEVKPVGEITVVD